MTQEAFIAKWKTSLAGLALFGVASETKDGPIKRAAYILEIPAQVEGLLKRMYDDLVVVKPAAANGTYVRK